MATRRSGPNSSIAPQVGREVLLGHRSDLELQLDAVGGGDRGLDRRLERVTPWVVGDDRTDLGEPVLLRAYSMIGPATVGAAGRQVRKVNLLSGVRIVWSPDLTRKVGIWLLSASGAVAPPTLLEMMPPTATTPSSTSRS